MLPAFEKVPPAPPGFDAERFFAGVHWHQRWQLFEGLFVPGPNGVEEMCDRMGLPSDLSGKRVLDIGAWNGCMSFECERRGAAEVIALGPEDPTITGFHRIRDVLNSTRTKYLLGSIYDLDPERLGSFDVVLCCGVIYHLRYPLLGIDNIRRVCKGDVFVETQVADGQFLVAGKSGPEWRSMASVSPILLESPLWQFYRFGELNQDTSNWFSPNAAAVIQAFESAGFETALKWSSGQRATFRGGIREGLPEFMALPCMESIFYDVLARFLFTGDRTRVPGPPRWSIESRRQIDAFPLIETGAGAPPAEVPTVIPRWEQAAGRATPLGRIKRLGKRLFRTIFPRRNRRAAA
jgi:tRNA (mo5U34)-methyltransferase